MSDRIKLTADDVTIDEDGAVIDNHTECSIEVIEYVEVFDGEEIDLSVYYEGDNYRIPAIALRIGAQLLEIAEQKGVIQTKF